MVDPTAMESAAMKACLRPFGEAAGEIGFDKPLGHYSEAEALAALPPGVNPDAVVPLEPVAHSLTHRELRLHPLLLDLPSPAPMPDGQWVACSALPGVGLPAPVRTLLDRLPD